MRLRIEAPTGVVERAGRSPPSQDGANATGCQWASAAVGRGLSVRADGAAGVSGCAGREEDGSMTESCAFAETARRSAAILSRVVFRHSSGSGSSLELVVESGQ